MNDFKQRMEDWRKYRHDHSLDGVVLTGIPRRTLSWFLFQSVEQRGRREKEEIEELEKLLESKRQEIREKRKKDHKTHSKKQSL